MSSDDHLLAKPQGQRTTLTEPELCLVPASSSASMSGGDELKTLVLLPSLPTIMENSSSIDTGSAAMVSRLEELSRLKRKRDWMSSLTQPKLNSSLSPRKDDASSLLTSVRVNNGSSLPAGWEQYLDLQSGETYYVNWNTRTKHCRMHCPEVQRCLGKLVNHKKNEDTEEKINTVRASLKLESWLAKMTAATSALINNTTTRPINHKASHSTTEALSRINEGKQISKQPNLDLNLACTERQNLIKSLTTNNDNYKHNNDTSLSFVGMQIPVLSKLAGDNIIHKATSGGVESTVQGPITSVCTNCNMFVKISSPSPQCPNCSHVLDTYLLAGATCNTSTTSFSLAMGDLS